MAEFAENNVQDTIAEVEEMERIGLLSNKEIKALIKKRREWEYRLARKSKNKEDFINCVNYEKKLLELLHIRRKQIGMHEKYREIERSISMRVMKRCRYITRYWPLHHDVWALRLNFAMAIGWHSEASITFAEQLRYHGNVEQLYISWARFEIEERGNFDIARKILLSKAPLYHRKSTVIKRELFRLELLYVESLQKRIEEDKALTEVIEENREKVLKCEIPRAVYQDSVKTIADPQLYLEFYQVASKFSFALDIREEIYKDLASAFPNSECFWKLKAQRTVLGLEPTVTEEGSEEPLKLLAIDKLKSAITVFDDALNAIGPSFVVSYIEELMLMLHASWSNSALSKLIFEKVLSLCEAYSSELLPLHYFIWVCILHKQSQSSNKLKTVLEDALKTYADSAPLQLEYFKQILNSDITEAEKLKEFHRLSSSLTGVLGVQIWEEAVQNIQDRKLKMKLFQSGSNHQNDSVAKRLRVRYLKWKCDNIKGLKASRRIYKKYGMRPPFCTQLHATMVMAELSKKKVNLDMVRDIFNNAILHHGALHPGIWLSYIHFEKSTGDPLKAGGLFTRAENELEAKRADVFRQLNMIIRDLQDKKAEEKSAKNEIWVTGKDTGEEYVEQKQAVVSLFEEELLLTYTADQERKAFFSKISDMKKLLEKGNEELPKEDGTEWEEVLERLLGEKVPLSIQQVTSTDVSSETEDRSIKINLVKPRSKYELSDRLVVDTDEMKSKTGEMDIEKILESSLTLKPEFMKQKQLDPYFVGKKKAKALRKVERQKTAGPGWFNMKAPELTDEVKRDLEILRMRSVLDPKRPFKSRENKVLPKYFQMGKIMDSPADFYSARIPKKKRKRTMAEEILHDEEAIRYQKRKYTEIITKRQQMQSKRKFQNDKNKKAKTNKKQRS